MLWQVGRHRALLNRRRPRRSAAPARHRHPAAPAPAAGAAAGGGARGGRRGRDGRRRARAHRPIEHRRLTAGGDGRRRRRLALDPQGPLPHRRGPLPVLLRPRGRSGRRRSSRARAREQTLRRGRGHVSHRRRVPLLGPGPLRRRPLPQRFQDRRVVADGNELFAEPVRQLRREARSAHSRERERKIRLRRRAQLTAATCAEGTDDPG